MNPICAHCNQQIQPNDEVSSSNLNWHKNCFKCTHCHLSLTIDNYQLNNRKPFCPEHVSLQDFIPGIETQINEGELEHAQYVDKSFLRLKEKKTLLIGLVNSFIDSVERLEEAKINFDDKNSLGRFIFEKYFKYKFPGCIEKLRAILGIMERANMKCVFIGKTSNGKSAVINALLGDKVLPSKLGSTTCCFIKIKGCDESKAYVIDKNGQKRDLDFLHKADETKDNRYNIDEMLQLFYPKDKYPLLSYDVELIDSPGLDHIKDNDKWIDKYCADANVFVMVLDCESGLSDSERRFLEEVKKKISKPNVIVLINKWDKTKKENEEDKNKLRKQHENAINEFFTKMLSSNLESLFFVSARKGLNGEDEGFKEFKKYLPDTITQNEYQILVVNHIEVIKDTVTEMLDLLMVKTNMKTIDNDIPGYIDQYLFKQEICNQEVKRILDDQDDTLVVEERLEATKHTIAKQLSDKFDQHVFNIKEEINNLFYENCGEHCDYPQLQVDGHGISFPEIFDVVMDKSVIHVKDVHSRDVNIFMRNATNSKSNSLFFVSATLGLKKKDKYFQCFQQCFVEESKSVIIEKLDTCARISRDEISSLYNIKSISLLTKIESVRVGQIIRHTEEDFDAIEKELKKLLDSIKDKDELEVKDKLRVLKSDVCDFVSNYSDKVMENIKKKINDLLDESCGGHCHYPQLQVGGYGKSVFKLFDSILENHVIQKRDEHLKDMNIFLNNATKSSSIFFVSAALGLKKKDKPFICFRKCLTERMTSVIEVIFYIGTRTISEELSFLHSIKRSPSLAKITNQTRKIIYQSLFKNDSFDTEWKTLFNSERGAVEVEEHIRSLKGRVCEQVSKKAGQQIIKIKEITKNLFEDKCGNVSHSPTLQFDEREINFPLIFDTLLMGKVSRVKSNHLSDVKNFLNNKTFMKSNSIFFVTATGAQEGKDKPFKSFIDRVLDDIKASTDTKLNPRIKSVSEEMSSLNETKSIHSIPNNITDEQIKYLVTKRFNKLRSEIKKEIDNTRWHVLLRINVSGFFYNEIDDKIQKLFETVLPNKISYIFSYQMKKLMTEVRELLTETILQDSDIKDFLIKISTKKDHPKVLEEKFISCFKKFYSEAVVTKVEMKLLLLKFFSWLGIKEESKNKMKKDLKDFVALKSEIQADNGSIINEVQEVEIETFLWELFKELDAKDEYKNSITVDLKRFIEQTSSTETKMQMSLVPLFNKLEVKKKYKGSLEYLRDSFLEKMNEGKEKLSFGWEVFNLTIHKGKNYPSLEAFSESGVREEYTDQVTDDFRSKWKAECSKIVSTMKTLDKQGFSMTINFLLTWWFRRLFEDKKTEYEKNFESVNESIKSFCKKDMVAPVQENVEKYLADAINKFNYHLKQMRGIKLLLDEEKNKWARIQNDIIETLTDE